MNLSPGFNSFQPMADIYVFRDESASLTIKEIRQLANSRFQIQATATPNAGIDGNAHYWLKMDVQSDKDHAIFLELAFPTLEKVTLYQIEDSKIVNTFETGFATPVKDRTFKDNNFVFPITLTQKQVSTLYIRVQTQGPIIIPINFWEKDSFYENNLNSHSLMAMYLGLVLALAIYNAILYFSVKDKTYLFYTLHLLGICWFQMSMMGYTAIYLWGDIASELRYREAPIAAALAITVAFQFTRQFLNIKALSQRLDRTLNIGSFIGFGFAIACSFAPLGPIIPALFAIHFLSVCILVIAAIYALNNGMRSARYFLTGWGIFIAGSMVQIQMYQNLLPFNFLTSQAILFTSGIEAILMSLALADRINLMRQDKVKYHKEALQSAEESNELKDQFLATISHELRTPMNGVLGALELVNFRNLPPEDRSAINVARLSSKRMLTLINGLLNYTEAQLDDVYVNKRAFKLPLDINDLVTHLEQACQSKHLETSFSTNFPKSTSFYGDIEKIRTILLHLTENALKFTREGRIDITINVTPQQDNQEQRCNLRVSITDTGVGISPSEQEKIFNAFDQLDADYNRQQGGMGIGLALVKRLVAILGGDIQLFSEPGKGTRFEIILPVEKFSEEPSDTQERKVSFIHEKYEPFILIAEDNDVNQKIMAALCSKLGYKTIVAINGEAAVSIAKQMSPALIFMDCQMPLMDGFEATRKIRLLNPEMHHVPIIAVTANASGKDQQRCFESGMNDHITKPISLNTVKSCLIRWLPKQQHHEKLLQENVQS
ncbi:MAG: ATP-binding protein [Pseudomonadales bacterium]|nr:ATP-binding protein [Pseudomonadales bacterium]